MTAPRQQPPRLTLDNVSHTHRGAGHPALERLSLDLGPGVVALLGPNGAGKSTLMRILATVVRPTAGRVLWNGTDTARRPEPLRRVLGYLPQDFGAPARLTAAEFLRYLAAAKGLPHRAARARTAELLAAVNLGGEANRRLGAMSGGMRQRVGIAQALLNDPRLLIVDEPTVGLDPGERSRFLDLLGELAADRIVLLSTHIVTDAAASADRIAVLSGGRLRRAGTVAELLRHTAGSVFETVVPSSELPLMRARWQIVRTARAEHGVRVRLLAPGGRPPEGAAPAAPELEDAYRLLVGEQPSAAFAAGVGAGVPA
ncbi:hypothetical protein BIV57_19930 [Mangrovactinospora gilvigrisea]|uniref:ABC transporter domain-containing protein n=1 Tax=Mangrovactinospora gilvigrisea TaxID=1428644 RepID=A0A1J7BAR1_9ACTN|nr:ABC transporter ATP-binding protein [Mangrovactinospora gilvigrisea]OIV35747.1 hypothetical protein BIV57_19930 [Mangrovactinospora gilvigrisea]